MAALFPTKWLCFLSPQGDWTFSILLQIADPAYLTHVTKVMPQLSREVSIDRWSRPATKLANLLLLHREANSKFQKIQICVVLLSLFWKLEDEMWSWFQTWKAKRQRAKEVTAYMERSMIHEFVPHPKHINETFHYLQRSKKWQKDMVFPQRVERKLRNVGDSKFCNSITEQRIRQFYSGVLMHFSLSPTSSPSSIGTSMGSEVRKWSRELNFHETPGSYPLELLAPTLWTRSERKICIVAK